MESGHMGGFSISSLLFADYLILFVSSIPWGTGGTGVSRGFSAKGEAAGRTT